MMVQVSRSASWLLWGAVIARGLVPVVRDWQRAPSRGTTAQRGQSAPQSVDPTDDQQVPAIIRVTPAATTSQRGSAPSQGSAGSGAGTAVPFGPGASGAGGLRRQRCERWDDLVVSNGGILVRIGLRRRRGHDEYAFVARFRRAGQVLERFEAHSDESHAADADHHDTRFDTARSDDDDLETGRRSSGDSGFADGEAGQGGREGGEEAGQGGCEGG